MVCQNSGFFLAQIACRTVLGRSSFHVDFDAASQAMATIDPLGRRNTNVFDANGRVGRALNRLRLVA